MTRRINLFLLSLLLLVGAPVWYLLLDSSTWNTPEKRLNITEMRKLAEAIPGQKPSRVEFEVIAWRRVPGNVFAAGTGFKRRLISVLAFRLDVPGQGPVMIETGTTSAFAKALGMQSFDAAAQGRIDQQVARANLILATHEHGDHLGGLAALSAGPDGAAIASHARLNRFQAPHGEPSVALPWAAGMLISAEITMRSAQAVAPGVVVVPSPGHSPGSQLIFVRLANGRELLFVGDTAPLASNWQQQRPPSRLLTEWISPQNRNEMGAWLRAIHQLKTQNPGVTIVPGHDYDWLVDPMSKADIQRLGITPRENPAGN